MVKKTQTNANQKSALGPVAREKYETILQARVCQCIAFPWEVGETAAIGRALAAMGYGLLPGAGLASAEDMLRAQTAKSQADGKGNGNGARFCSFHQAALEPHGKGWAHRLKSGVWCYGANNNTAPPARMTTGKARASARRFGVVACADRERD